MKSKRQPDDEKPLTPAQARRKLQKGLNDFLAGNDPGPITFRLKRTKKADETYPLKLTQQQRESMVHATRIRNKLKERLQQAGDGTQIVGFTLKELDYLNDELGQAAMYAPGPDKKRLVAVLHKVTDLLSEEHAGVFEGVVPKIRKTAPKKGDLIYQFKITLLDIKPPGDTRDGTDSFGRKSAEVWRCDLPRRAFRADAGWRRYRFATEPGAGRRRSGIHVP